MDSRLRRKQILKNAAVLFGQYGYHATSITDIIEAAGIARGTFYLYFHNKRAIFEELLDRLVVQIRERIRVVDVSPGARSAKAQLQDNLVGVLELLTENRPLLSILLEGAVGLDKGFDEKLSDFYQRLAATIEGSLTLGQKMGLVRDRDTRIAALAGIGMVKEVLHSLLRNDSRVVDLPGIAAQLLDIFSYGVLTNDTTIMTQK